MSSEIKVYIALGSNLGAREATIRRAVDLLRQTPGIRVLKVSALRETKPIGGPPGQRDFLNGVAAIKTALAPLDLLDRLQEIENKLGRRREHHWGPRTIDLDVLFYGDQTIRHPRLAVPHPEIGNRPFLRAALQELGFALSFPRKRESIPTAVQREKLDSRLRPRE